MAKIKIKPWLFIASTNTLLMWACSLFDDKIGTLTLSVMISLSPFNQNLYIILFFTHFPNKKANKNNTKN
ncbi:hypothetical protein S4054249_25220 [Pseudoalteromonas luteoviolacea]|uniref:Uncharacterized protein n=1 Tax=Pseudoalteromonas luteoviolacea S4054 TaxID=1129367 RepID=A0A0F6A7T8_9GAMM|nr:hypothetical protein S4054249_25220 [Pseudoalteromonas luteoviolacea]AOT15700.1 hypothetical protein S40542_23290 [Pseudoalteromonas luteoviolacea]AOT20957.1 hypothetical protein S4054_25140 [Pseudoalteromonas luteoviolacea]KKE82240.1 hypothetical protein N479_19270 [Pseudoalteromonas luteoviolacea S4054]KZN65427.1 hypothetical protein N481_25060 [Pseudoalteromonas luteoviolacea S4047-1]